MDAASWRAYGVLVIDGFLTRQRARQLAALIRDARGQPAPYFDGERSLADGRLRSARLCAVPPRVARHEHSRLTALLPRLRRMYGPLTSIESPSYLRYRRGDHFAPHIDVLDHEAQAGARSRRVSISIALQSTYQGYSGGALALYDVLGDPAWRDVPIPIEVEAGTLVAFRSDVKHAVSKVTRGTRCSIVAWAHGPTP